MHFIKGKLVNQLPADGQGFAVSPFRGRAQYISGQPQRISHKQFRKIWAGLQWPLPTEKMEGIDRSKKAFVALVEQAVADIHAGKMKKVVTARRYRMTQQDIAPNELFLEICEQYRNCFCSMVYLPGAGLWLGASPEVLVQQQGAETRTFSLAGTISKNGEQFTDKERQEQLLVTKYIADILKQEVDAVAVGATRTIAAGAIRHLRTIIKFSSRELPVLKAAQLLHPTPAIAGLPKKEAQQFILRQEGFPRALYSGFIGPVHPQKTSLWVNLRCMQFHGRYVVFYAGCGITAQSQPEKEWLETERKMDILRHLLA